MLRVMWICVPVMLALPVRAAVPPAPPAAEQSVGSRLLGVTNEMWFLLSGVVDTASADAAAGRFAHLVKESTKLSDAMFDTDAQAQDLEALDQETYRIAEAYEELSYEFESLCRVRCFGSTSLIVAFLQAMRDGVFSDESEELLQRTTILLTEQAANAEISRLEHMAPPDRELLRILSCVRDTQSATAAVAQLAEITKQMRKLIPVNRLRTGNFPETRRAALTAACGRLEPTLWQIRNQIVRIVSLPGYDGAQYDDFSDALDSAFESLGDTHAECFDDIFDESFRSDLDDALHESVTSSQR